MRTGKERQIGWIRTGLLGVAALCIVIGAVRGEAQEVLVKAVNILSLIHIYLWMISFV